MFSSFLADSESVSSNEEEQQQHPQHELLSVSALLDGAVLDRLENALRKDESWREIGILDTESSDIHLVLLLLDQYVSLAGAKKQARSIHVTDFRAFESYIISARQQRGRRRNVGGKSGIGDSNSCSAFEVEQSIARLLFTQRNSSDLFRVGPKEIYKDVKLEELLAAVLHHYFHDELESLAGPLGNCAGTVVVPTPLSWVARGSVLSACEMCGFPVATLRTTSAALCAAFLSTKECKELLLEQLGIARILVVEVGREYLSASIVAFETVLSNMGTVSAAASSRSSGNSPNGVFQQGDNTLQSASSSTIKSKKNQKRRKKKGSSSESLPITPTTPKTATVGAECDDDFINFASSTPSSPVSPTEGGALHFSLTSGGKTVLRVESSSGSAAVGLDDWVNSEGLVCDTLRDCIHAAVSNDSLLLQDDFSALGSHLRLFGGFLLWIDADSVDASWLTGHRKMAGLAAAQDEEGRGQSASANVEVAVRSIVESELALRLALSPPQKTISSQEGKKKSPLREEARRKPAQWLRLPRHGLSVGARALASPQSSLLVFEAPARSLGLRVKATSTHDAAAAQVVWFVNKVTDLSVSVSREGRDSLVVALKPRGLGGEDHEVDEANDRDEGGEGETQGVQPPKPMVSCKSLGKLSFPEGASEVHIEVVEDGNSGSTDDSIGVICVVVLPLPAIDERVAYLDFSASGGALSMQVTPFAAAAESQMPADPSAPVSARPPSQGSPTLDEEDEEDLQKVYRKDFPLLSVVVSIVFLLVLAAILANRALVIQEAARQREECGKTERERENRGPVAAFLRKLKMKRK
jgi:hypothetical protein